MKKGFIEEERKLQKCTIFMKYYSIPLNEQAIISHPEAEAIQLFP